MPWHASLYEGTGDRKTADSQECSLMDGCTCDLLWLYTFIAVSAGCWFQGSQPIQLLGKSKPPDYLWTFFLVLNGSRIKGKPPTSSHRHPSNCVPTAESSQTHSCSPQHSWCFTCNYWSQCGLKICIASYIASNITWWGGPHCLSFSYLSSGLVFMTIHQAGASPIAHSRGNRETEAKDRPGILHPGTQRWQPVPLAPLLHNFTLCMETEAIFHRKQTNKQTTI